MIPDESWTLIIWELNIIKYKFTIYCGLVPIKLLLMDFMGFCGLYALVGPLSVLANIVKEYYIYCRSQGVK